MDIGKVREIFDRLYSRFGDLNGGLVIRHSRLWLVQSSLRTPRGPMLKGRSRNFGDRLVPEFIAVIDATALSEIIRPAGAFTRKAGCLKDLTDWFAGYDYNVAKVQNHELRQLRKELLAIKGIGPETADSILLYAFDFPTFVIDAYTRRLCERYPLAAGRRYHEVQAFFQRGLPPNAEIYNHYHALIVVNAKTHCRAKPICDGCPLFNTCSKHYRED